MIAQAPCFVAIATLTHTHACPTRSPLDLSDLEFEPVLPPLYNTSCRDHPPQFPIPQGPAPQPAPNTVHVRLFYADGAPTVLASAHARDRGS